MSTLAEMGEFANTEYMQLLAEKRQVELDRNRLIERCEEWQEKCAALERGQLTLQDEMKVYRNGLIKHRHTEECQAHIRGNAHAQCLAECVASHKFFVLRSPLQIQFPESDINEGHV